MAGGLPKYASSVDANQKAIVKALRAAGAIVVILKIPLDLLVLYDSRVFLFEVKMPNGRVADHQERFIAEWCKAGGSAAVVRSATEALTAIGALEGSVEFGPKVPAGKSTSPWLNGEE